MRRSLQLARQWSLYDRNAHERALQQARTLLPRLPGPQRQEAYRLIGLCYHHRDKPQKAVYWLRRACEGSDDSQVWLELALAALKAADRELSRQAFEQVRLCQQVARYAQLPGFHLQLFWYAGSLLDPLPRPADGDAWARAKLDVKRQREQARELLDELATAYGRLYLTDTAFLYVRGMPFLSSFLTLTDRFFRIQGELAEGVTWLRELKAALDPQGQHQVQQAIRALQGKDRKGKKKRKRRKPSTS